AQWAALRQRTRCRKKLIEQRSSEGQRPAKVLEEGIKIDSVASDMLGKSGRAMTGGADTRGAGPGPAGRAGPGRAPPQDRGAGDSLRRLVHRGPRPDVPAGGLDAYNHLTAKIAELDALVAEAAAPFAALIARLITIPGIGQRTVEVIIAETG